MQLPGTEEMSAKGTGPLRSFDFGLDLGSVRGGGSGGLGQTDASYALEPMVMRPLVDGERTFAPFDETAQSDVWTYDQIAQQLTVDFWGLGGPFIWDVGSDNILTVDVGALDSDAKFLARQALKLWTDVAGFGFVEVSGSAEITFTQDGTLDAHASFPSGLYVNSDGSYTPIEAEVNISQDWLTSFGNTLGSYGFQTYIHEIGHALGLGHGGDYDGNADYAVDAKYANDAWSTTVMSYFSQIENTYFSGQGFDYAFVVTPMIGDVIGIYDNYSQPTGTRTGNTRYGFNSNSDRLIHYANNFADVAYTIVDSGGRDLLDYSGFAAAQLIDLSPEVFMNIGGLVGNVMIGRGTDIENAIGGSGQDTIHGNGLANILVGNDGDDLLFGKGGSDALFGKAGADTIDGGSSSDVVRGNAGEDVLSGGSGDDIIKGDTDNDTLNGDAGDDTIFGGPGNDIISGNENADLLVGDGGRDTIWGGADADLIQGGLGGDFLYGQGGDDRVEGNEGTDEVFGNGGDDILRGGDGNDLLDGGDGQDTIKGDADNDTVFGGDADDIIYGNDGNDVLFGQGGNDTLFGGAGADVFGFEDALVSGNVDHISDFDVSDDSIRMDLAIFSELSGSGTITTAEFAIGSSSLDVDDRIIYNSATGELFYDEDGTGASAQMLFATLSTGLALTNADFTAVGAAQGSAPNASPSIPADFIAMPPQMLGMEMMLA